MKNKKIILTAMAMLVVTFAYAQKSGVKTKNPKGALQVDSKKNNPAVPTAADEADDFIVDVNGNVGIGTTTPNAKLTIDNGINPGAIRIVDGTQLAGRVLTSDANGVGTWTSVPSFRATVIGQVEVAGSVNADGTTSTATTYTGTAVYTGMKIVLTGGTWAVNAGLTFSNITQNAWHHCFLSSSTTDIQQTGFSHLGPAGNQTSYAGILIKDAKDNSPSTNGIGFITGSSIIKVPDNTTVTVYLVFERWPSKNIFTYSTGNWENFFYAVPVVTAP